MRRCPHRGRENMFADRAYSQGLVASPETVPDDSTGDELRQSRGGSSRRGLDVESLARQARQCAHDLVLGHRNDLATGSAYGREHFTYARRFRRGYALRDGWGDGCRHEMLHPCLERRVVGRAVGSLHAKQTRHPVNLTAAQELGESAVAPKHVGAIADREHDVVRCAGVDLLFFLGMSTRSRSKVCPASRATMCGAMEQAPGA